MHFLDSVGVQLEQARGERGWTIDACAANLDLTPQAIEQIERGGCEVPANAFLRQQLKRYAQGLGLSWEPLWQQVLGEKALCVHQPCLPLDPSFSTFLSRAVYWRRWIAPIALFSFAMLYLGSTVLPVLTPPLLVVERPSEQEVTFDTTMVVQGRTTADAQVAINGNDVARKSLDGSFSDTLTLQPGLNTIVVTATKKKVRQTSITRHVYVEASPRRPVSQHVLLIAHH